MPDKMDDNNTTTDTTVTTSAALLTVMRGARDLAGLSQQQLADRMGVHCNTVQQREAGQKPVSVHQFQEHLSACGVSTRWLASALVSSVGTERDDGGDKQIADSWDAYRKALRGRSSVGATT